jgi:hypothetical protein
LWNRTFPQENRNSHQQDAFSSAEWMRRADANGSLAKFFRPELNSKERTLAEIEGWMLGLP